MSCVVILWKPDLGKVLTQIRLQTAHHGGVWLWFKLCVCNLKVISPENKERWLNFVVCYHLVWCFNPFLAIHDKYSLLYQNLRQVQQYDSLYWCQALHITNKYRYQNNKGPLALTLLNSLKMYFGNLYFKQCGYRSYCFLFKLVTSLRCFWPYAAEAIYRQHFQET